MLPIVARELRVRARQPRVFYTRLVSAGVVILIVGLALLLTSLSNAGAAGQGLFQMLLWGSFLFCVTEGLRSTADSLSEEKRSGTLGLLFLTDLHGYDVVLGKLIATSLTSFYALLAILPPLGIPILLGGVTGGEFWRAALTLVNTLFFSLTAGLMVSALCRAERKVWSGTLAILVLFVVVPPVVEALVAGSMRLPAWVTRVSPTTMLLAAPDASYANLPGRFWNAFWSVHLFGWLFMGAASVILPRAWQDEPAAPGKSREVSLLDRFARRGSTPGRADGQLLAPNPTLWLAARGLGRPTFFWVLNGIAFMIALAGWYLTGRSTDGLVMVCLALLGVQYVMVLRVAWEASHLFAEARDSGALEILLCTPMSPAEIIEGHQRALRRLFLHPALALGVIELGLLGAHAAAVISSGKDDFRWALLSLGALVTWGMAFMDLYAVAYYGLWLGLKLRKPSQALSRTILYVIALPLATAFCCVFLPVVAVVKNLLFINYGRDQLLRHFRDVVAGRYDTGDEGLRELKNLLPLARRDGQLPPVLPGRLR